MYKRILITGGAGFAGSSLAIFLAQQLEGVAIWALDNLKRRGSERNLPRLAAAGVRFFHGDVRNPEDLFSLPGEPDLIIECSAEPSAQAGYGSPCTYLIETNLQGCFHCLELARRSGADFLFVSTSRVYPYRALNEIEFVEAPTRFELAEKQSLPGMSRRGTAEEFPLEGPRSLYGMTKLSAELMTEEFADAYGFRYVIDRFGVLTGPHQMGKVDQGVVALWVGAHFYRRPLSYIGFGGTGKQVRDFLHIDDFCDLVLDQIRHFDVYCNRRWNVGGGREHSLSLLELTELARQATGNVVPIESVPDNRPADVRIYLTDASRVSAVRGWQPRRDAATTVADIARWIDSDRDALAPLFLA